MRPLAVELVDAVWDAISSPPEEVAFQFLWQSIENWPFESRLNAKSATVELWRTLSASMGHLAVELSDAFWNAVSLWPEDASIKFLRLCCKNSVFESELKRRPQRRRLWSQKEALGEVLEGRDDRSEGWITYPSMWSTRVIYDCSFDSSSIQIRWLTEDLTQMKVGPYLEK